LFYKGFIFTKEFFSESILDIGLIAVVSQQDMIAPCSGK